MYIHMIKYIVASVTIDQVHIAAMSFASTIRYNEIVGHGYLQIQFFELHFKINFPQFLITNYVEKAFSTYVIKSIKR